MDGTVLYKLSYGLYAIGAMDQSRMCGCIVNTVFQITSDGVIALSMNRNNYTHGLIERSGRILGKHPKRSYARFRYWRSRI